jgi:hypothetical protein
MGDSATPGPEIMSSAGFSAAAPRITTHCSSPLISINKPSSIVLAAIALLSPVAKVEVNQSDITTATIAFTIRFTMRFTLGTTGFLTV